MDLSMKQKQNPGYKEQTGGCQGQGEWRRDRWGVWGQQIQTVTYRMDKQQGSVAQKLYLVSCDKL